MSNTATKNSMSDIKPKFTVNRKGGVNKVTLDKINFLSEFSVNCKEKYGDISVVWTGEPVPILKLPAPLGEDPSADEKVLKKKKVDVIGERQSTREQDYNKMIGAFVNAIDPAFYNAIRGDKKKLPAQNPTIAQVINILSDLVPSDDQIRGEKIAAEEAALAARNKSTPPPSPRTPDSGRT